MLVLDQDDIEIVYAHTAKSMGLGYMISDNDISINNNVHNTNKDNNTNNSTNNVIHTNNISCKK